MRGSHIWPGELFLQVHKTVKALARGKRRTCLHAKTDFIRVLDSSCLMLIGLKRIVQDVRTEPAYCFGSVWRFARVG